MTNYSAKRRIVKRFVTDSGSVVAKVYDDGVLKKYERQKDRLRVTGYKHHAVDLSMLNEAWELGARRLELVETADDGKRRLFKISFEGMAKGGRRLTLAGRERLTVPLDRCEVTDID
ncbi:MAG: hypothetical protein WCY56_03105 [Aminobacteriaceae bacterium]